MEGKDNDEERDITWGVIINNFIIPEKHSSMKITFV